MRKTQRGVSLGGLLVVLFVLIMAGLLAMKVAPPYMEFASVRKAVASVAGGGSPAEIRKAFDARAAVDDIASVKGADLDITKEGGAVVVSVYYRKEVPLFSNVGLYFDFSASSKEEQ